MEVYFPDSQTLFSLCPTVLKGRGACLYRERICHEHIAE